MPKRQVSHDIPDRGERRLSIFRSFRVVEKRYLILETILSSEKPHALRGD